MPKLGRAEDRVDAHKMYMERVQAMKDQDKGLGWYQDSEGNLYHFNGSAWDVVPEEMTKRLEYLG